MNQLGHEPGGRPEPGDGLEPSEAPEPSEAAGHPQPPPATARERQVRDAMNNQQLYTDAGADLQGLAAQRTAAKERVAAFNSSAPSDEAGREALLRDLLGSVGTECWVEPPLHAMYGRTVHFGDHVYANVGLTLVDDVEITVGHRVMFAPHVTVTTTGHPVHPALRAQAYQFSAPVVIEDDVWIGSNVTILPGVRIGAGSVIAAGAVVHANVPPMVVVGGTPAKILRRITDADLQWTYRAPRDL